MIARRRSLELYESCRLGDVALVSQLLKANAPVDGASDDQESPLAVAAAKGHLPVMALLISSGANIEREDELGVRPLQRAAAAGQVGAIEILLGAGDLDLNHVDSINGTAMHAACKRGHSGVVKLLLEVGASVDARNSCGQTALFLAAQLGHTDCIKLLLAAGADPHAETPRGQTPLGAVHGSWIGEDTKKRVYSMLEECPAKALMA